MESPIMRQANLRELQSAATREDWDFVDTHLTGLSNDPKALDWSTNKGLTDEDDNLRDLAVSLLEKSSAELKPDITKKLLELFEDKNPYVGFRSAFALFSHGDRSPEVLAKIHEAVLDEEVREIAEGYLSQLAE